MKLLGKEVKIKNMDLIDALSKSGIQRFDIEKMPIRDLVEMICKSNPEIKESEIEDAINEDFGFLNQIYEVVGNGLKVKNSTPLKKG